MRSLDKTLTESQRKAAKLSAESVKRRLDAATRLVIAAAPVLMYDKFKFDGDEIHGNRKSACFLNEEDWGV